MRKQNYLCLLIFNLLFSIAYSQSPCLSEGLESLPTGTINSFPGWTLSTGSYTIPGSTGYCLNYPANSTVVPVVTILSTPYIFVGPPQTPSAVPNSPFSGTNITQLTTSDLSNPENFKKAEYLIAVSPSNKFFQFAYFTRAFYTGHTTCCEDQYLKFKMVDAGNNDIPCTSYTIGAPTSSSLICSSTNTNGLVYGTNCIYTPNWMIVSVDLSSYMSTNVKLIAEVGMCSFGTHHQEVFLDTKCSPLPVYVTNGTSTINGNTITVCNVPTAFLKIMATQSHTWAGPMGSFSANSNTAATSPVTGIYTANISNPVCGSPNTFTFFLQLGISPNITVMPTSSIICNGGSVNLNISGSGATSYSWSTGVTTQSIIVSPTVTTNYTAIASSSIGCITTTVINIQVANCASLKELAGIVSELFVYPNPGKSEINFVANSECQLEVMNLMGKIIHSTELTSLNNYSQQIIIQDPGVYFVINKNTAVALKLIIVE